MSAILKLHEKKPNENLVNHLKFLLAEAERGELRGLVYVGRVSESYCRGRSGDWSDNYALLGVAEMLKEEILTEVRETFTTQDVPDQDPPEEKP